MKPVKKLKKDLDRIFSVYIRLRDDGVCYTCGVKKDPKEMQCGHFVLRQYNSLRYDEVNCHCQCVGCNMFKYGNMSVYAERLVKQYGPSILTKLNKQKNIIKQFTSAELEKLIAKYKKKVSKLL